MPAPVKALVFELVITLPYKLTVVPVPTDIAEADPELIKLSFIFIVPVPAVVIEVVFIVLVVIEVLVNEIAPVLDVERAQVIAEFAIVTLPDVVVADKEDPEFDRLQVKT